MLTALLFLLALQVPPNGPDERAAELARRAVAADLGVEPASLIVRSVTPREWTPAQFECHRGPAAPGTAGPTLRGYRVVLASGVRVVPVNVSGDRAVVCPGLALEAPLTPEPPDPQESHDPAVIAALPVLPEPADQAGRDRVAHARDDLRRRLQSRAATIDLVGYRAVTWRDGSLGCPKAGMAYPQALVPGVVIELRAEGRLWSYHAGGTRPPFYCSTPVKPAPGPDPRADATSTAPGSRPKNTA